MFTNTPFNVNKPVCGHFQLYFLGLFVKKEQTRPFVLF